MTKCLQFLLAEQCSCVTNFCDTFLSYINYIHVKCEDGYI